MNLNSVSINLISYTIHIDIYQKIKILYLSMNLL